VPKAEGMAVKNVKQWTMKLMSILGAIVMNRELKRVLCALARFGQAQAKEAAVQTKSCNKVDKEHCRHHHHEQKEEDQFETMTSDLISGTIEEFIEEVVQRANTFWANLFAMDTETSRAEKVEPNDSSVDIDVCSHHGMQDRIRKKSSFWDAFANPEYHLSSAEDTDAAEKSLSREPHPVRDERENASAAAGIRQFFALLYSHMSSMRLTDTDNSPYPSFTKGAFVFADAAGQVAQLFSGGDWAIKQTHNMARMNDSLIKRALQNSGVVPQETFDFWTVVEVNELRFSPHHICQRLPKIPDDIRFEIEEPEAELMSAFAYVLRHKDETLGLPDMTYVKLELTSANELRHLPLAVTHYFLKREEPGVVRFNRREDSKAMYEEGWLDLKSRDTELFKSVLSSDCGLKQKMSEVQQFQALYDEHVRTGSELAVPQVVTDRLFAELARCPPPNPEH
jgi:hypothetical protein